MTQKASVAPMHFRGLRVLLVDNDTSSLLHMASMLEDYSYQVTTTELASVALYILQERMDSFDLVIADVNTLEMGCLKFIRSVKFLNDFPVILMSTQLEKDVIEDAMTKGASFFLKKPLSAKILANIWQHIYRTRNHKNGKVKTKSNAADQEVKSEGSQIGEKEVLEIIDIQEPENEHVGSDNDQITNDLAYDNADGKRSRTNSIDCNGPPDLKRKRARDEGGDQRPITFTHYSQRVNSRIIVGNGTNIEGKESTSHEKKTCMSSHFNFNEVLRAAGERVRSPDTEADNERALQKINMSNLTQIQNCRGQSPTTELTREMLYRRSSIYNSSFPLRVESLGTLTKEHDRLCHKGSDGVNNVLNSSSFTSPSGTVITDLRAKSPLEFDGLQAYTDSRNFPASILKLLQAKDIKKAQIASEVSLDQRMFAQGLTNMNQDVDPNPKDPAEHRVQVTRSDTNHQ